VLSAINKELLACAWRSYAGQWAAASGQRLEARPRDA
jgi:hypothetical protein